MGPDVSAEYPVNAHGGVHVHHRDHVRRLEPLTLHDPHPHGRLRLCSHDHRRRAVRPGLGQDDRAAAAGGPWSCSTSLFGHFVVHEISPPLLRDLRHHRHAQHPHRPADHHLRQAHRGQGRLRHEAQGKHLPRDRVVHPHVLEEEDLLRPCLPHPPFLLRQRRGAERRRAGDRARRLSPICSRQNHALHWRRIPERSLAEHSLPGQVTA
mmetsp:Transcript_2496/g.5983  ORF Transcript_2496/g.5983 Transcript_2496/m.5983 type:complete len:209 (-) Transcript_2496:56-682(-)